MKHELDLEGLGFRLRPVGDADVAFILELRTDPESSRYLHPVSPRIEDQLAWLARYYERPGEYFFVIEHRVTGRAEGLISLYEVDSGTGRGEWGRWILKKGSLAAVESAWLIYRVAFEELKLNELYCRTVAANVQVVSFHDSCGITDRRVLPVHFELNGERLDAVEHRVDVTRWEEMAPRLENLARRMLRRVKHD